ncbi:protein ROS1A-like [Diospyros lotus]|uniref:protein ROS1A-like n=1 Tax=Diospyros lotus TaxID=55363 RepID=UPI0022508499|nr:protein ROS1A-like [Diospyros lotus]XP_052174811.1 protein ROS1A-like [Diospyros lotus]XP_052174812.1 protein ROS1A-like [Diospyros lotus]
MDMRRETSVPDTKEFQTHDLWVPTTPVKNIPPEKQPICEEKQENQPGQANCFVPDGFSTGLQKETQAYGRTVASSGSVNTVDLNKASAAKSRASADFSKFSELVMDSERFPRGHFTSLMALADAAGPTVSLDGTRQGDVNGAGSPFMSFFRPQFESNQYESDSTACIAGQQSSLGSNSWSNSSCAPDAPLYGIHMPFQSTNHLSSQLRESDALSSRNISVASTDALSRSNISQFAPLTSTDAISVASADALSSGNISQFAPLTSDQSKKAENKQVHNMHYIHVDGKTCQETINQGNEVSMRVEVIDLYHDKQKTPLDDLSSAAFSMQLHENHNPDKGGNPGIDVKTPQQKPRRRKHRPKVVTEGKPKRTRKPKTANPSLPKDNQTGKRKYVRKNGLNKIQETSPTEGICSGSDLKVPLGTKTCRRKLKFEGQEREETSCKARPNENAEAQAQNFYTRGDSQSTVQLDQRMEAANEKTQMGIAHSHASSINKVVEDCISISEKQSQSYLTPSNTDPLQQKSMASAESEGTRGKCKIVFSDETHDKQGTNVQMVINSENQPAPSPNDSNSSSSAQQERTLKRVHSCTIDEAELSRTNIMGCQCNSLQEYHKMFPANVYDNATPGINFPSIHKKKRTGKEQFSTTSSPLSIRTAAEISMTGTTSSPLNNAYAGPYISGTNCAVLAAQSNTSCTSTKTASLVEAHDKQQLYECKLAFEQKGRMIKKRSKASTHHPDATKDGIPAVDVITDFLKTLDISLENNQVTYQHQCELFPYGLTYEEQNALVLYQRGGPVVPFQNSFHPIKKRQLRPKVDLDGETDRVWKLLLENINSEGIDGTDEEKAKWWEEERRVFQGRADSFIARMHLVQGDRRFSPWKGSVVDSVVGVFLTQNVSDHLSSSAFMSLAAHYPLKQKHNERPYFEDTSILVEEPGMCAVYPEDTIRWHEEKSNLQAWDMNSMTLHGIDLNVEKEVVNSSELIACSSDGVKPIDKSECKCSDISEDGIGISHNSTANRDVMHLQEAVASSIGDKREMDDVFSSQNSVGSCQNSMDSSIAQTSEKVGSYLQDNAEEDPAISSNSIGLVGSSFVDILPRTETTCGIHNHKNGNESSYRETRQTNMNGSECDTQKENKHISDYPKTSLRPVIASSNYHSEMIPDSGVQEVESIETLQDNTSLSNTSMHKENCTSEQSGVTAEYLSQAMEENIMTASFQKQKYSSKNNHAHNSLQDQNCGIQQVLEVPNLSRNTLDVTESTSEINNPQISDHKAVESSLKNQDYLPSKNINGSSDAPEVKRRRVGKPKEKVDWDSLRQKAQTRGKRERTVNTMDSLNWEAVRCADVSEVANTIKDRGMNNVLAGRIKDFLNRLVREHGSIDLEWLRDVPPDEAKEYLLSIRGLGLKSVECVRLLTLHHLAFPVDTNVGRIAVRLGWVPLQPLPESLQLHLLELYPVLESIQKYLWPRLCKLDQRTLYELHYQMITFGKVFCTKSKPNCNACPMRGECRHFASAFASARLALPGPEEKSIVSARDNKAAGQRPVEIIKSLQLPLPLTSQQMQDQPQMINFEPIIEVPSTPEPIIEVPATPEPEHLQVPERDIEDAFCEDPEEIPVIKLNIEEFTQNLQNYMQQNMELQEDKMSKALVALTPEAASIPMPRLKNVSQLRTEHQVYELPDSHPLLKQLDKREPDDPCSYLLAIWTPGETANSIQAPEGRCNFQELGKLCDEKTCFSCNSIREANSQTVRGTLLIPCRTAMRGSFPLNGTYFQVNEVFADHESSLHPIDVPRAWIWNLTRRTVYFGTSIPTIFKGLSTESIQHCFWRGFVCVRGFDQKTRAPRPLIARLHFPASKLTRTKSKTDQKQE